MPPAWKEGTGIFLPKPGKEIYFEAKFFRMITLTFFQLKWLERLILYHINEDNNVQAGPARGRFRGYIVPGPLLRGARLKGPGRVQVSALSFGITPEHRNQTCPQQKYQSAYILLVIGRYFCYTTFRASNSGRFD